MTNGTAQHNIDKAIRIIFYSLVFISILFHFRKNFMYSLDDSYITFRYAQNLSEGYGLRFNVDEKYFGSTAMGFAIILGVISYVMDTLTHNSIFLKDQIATSGALIPILANMISAISLGVIVTIIFKVGDAVLGIRNGFIVSMFFFLLMFLAPASNNVSGHETYTYLAVLCVALYAFFILNWFVISGLLLGLATTFRPDSILMFLIMFSILSLRYLVSQQRHQVLTSILRFVGGFLVLMIPWIVFCDIYFGQILPGTMTAKQAQVILGGWHLYTINMVAKETIMYFGGYLVSMLILSILAAIILLLSLNRSITAALHDPLLCIIISLMLFGAGQAIFYSLVKVTYWPWYLTPFLFVLTVGGAVSTIALVRLLLHTTRLVRAWTTLVLLVVFIFGVASLPRIEYWFTQWFSNQRNVFEHSFSYDPIVLYLRKNEPTGTTIATAEPGALGFKLGPAFKVIDELGLVSPGVAKKIIDGDMKYPFVTWDPEYVVVSWEGNYTPNKSEWFNERYYLIGEFDHQSFWKNNINRGAYLFKKRTEIISEIVSPFKVD